MRWDASLLLNFKNLLMNYKFTPVRIRAWLQTGVISDQFLPLDGVLYGQYVREKLGERHVSVPLANTVPEGQSISLPFRKANRANEEWFYKCSFAQWPDRIAEDKQSYAKRFDLSQSGLVDFGKKKPQVDNQRGHYKAVHNKVYYRHALYVEWYADADIEALRNMLRFCTHIGKKTAQGWGAVLRWEVIEWPEDWAVRGPGNKLMRAVPAHGGVVYGLRPSYWLPKHQFPCLLPS